MMASFSSVFGKAEKHVGKGGSGTCITGPVDDRPARAKVTCAAPSPETQARKKIGASECSYVAPPFFSSRIRPTRCFRFVSGVF
jgi:hypothetical protein